MSDRGSAAPAANDLAAAASKLKKAETVDKSAPIVKGEADDQAEKVTDAK